MKIKPIFKLKAQLKKNKSYQPIYDYISGRLQI